MTTVREAMEQSFIGEAKAVLRLHLYAEKAETEGYPQLAKLFRAVAASETVHGARCLRLLKEIKGTEENLAQAFDAETRIAGVAYDRFLQLALAEGDRAAEVHFSQSRDAEAVHAKLYKEAMDHLMAERETTYHVCQVCGYVSDGVLPDECPICGVKKDKFKQVD